MANKADMLWEDVLELEEAGERLEALDLCRRITRMEPDHAAAWKMTARMTLPAARRGVQDCLLYHKRLVLIPHYKMS